MSNMKKLASLLLAMIMVFAMTVTAFAAGTTYTVTIKNDEDGYVYTAYQIFDGDLDTSGKEPVLTNIKWGNGIDSTNTDLQTILTTEYGTYKADEVAEKITSQAKAEEFADIVGKYLVSTAGINSTDEGDTYTITVDDAGYYLIKNTTVPAGSDVTYTNYIMQIMANVTVDPKAPAPSSDKTVSDINDSEDKSTAYTDGQTSADHDIGDVVPFALTATMPTNYGAYEKYQLIFHDVMDPSLTFNSGSVVVSVGGAVVDESCYTVKTYGYEVANITAFATGTTYYTYDTDQKTFTAVDSTAVYDANTVYYTKGADCYHIVSITAFATGTTYYTYDGSTYSEVTDTSGTPDKDTTYYVKADCTFEVQIADTKSLVNANGNSIHVAADSVITVTYTATLNENAVIGNPGNKNTSYITYSNNPTWDGNGTEPTGETPPETVVVFTYKLVVDKVDENGDPLTGAGFTLYKFDEDENKYVAVGSEITGTSMTEFTWTGLDDGDYMLVESTTPSGYNTMDNLYFTVKAVHTVDGITSLTITDAQGETFTGNLTFTATSDTGEIETDIVNGAGSTLPGTGGIGTTIFYIVGGLLVFGAVVLLITRRRMRRA